MRIASHSRAVTARQFWRVGLVALFGFWSASVHSQSDPSPLPLEIRTDKVRLSHGIFALSTGDRVYFPLRELADALDFYIEIDPNSAFAEGWVIEEERKVSFNANTGEVVVEGQRIEVGEEAFLTDHLQSRRELYVSRAALNKAWPVDLDINMAQLSVRLNPSEPLPFQIRRERAERRDRLLARKGKDTSNYIWVENPYRFQSKPVFDVNATADLGQGAPSGRYQIDWVHDLFHSETSGSLNFLTDPDGVRPTNARLTFRRSALVAPLPMGIRDIQAGDVTRRALSRIGGLGRGRGVMVSGFPLERAEQFDTTTVEGNAPVGYEAELYRNQQLLEFQEVGDDGRYAFEDVPLLFGNNRLRVVLYGPQGQQEERVQVVNTSGALARPGQTIARGSLVDVGSDFIPLGDAPSSDNAGLAATAIAAHGFSQRFSGFGAITNVPTEAGARQYGILGLNASYGAATGQVRALSSVAGGLGLDANVLAALGPVRTNMSLGVFDGFTSPDVGFGDNAKTFDAEIDTNTRINLGFTTMNLEVDSRYERRRDDRTRLNLESSQRMRFSRTRFNHELSRNLGDNDNGITAGSLNLSRRLRPINLRGGFDYEIPFDARFLRATARYRGRGEHDPSLGVRFQRGFNDARDSVSLDLSGWAGNILASLSTTWREDRGFSLGVRVNFGFAPDADGDYRLAPRGVTNHGRVVPSVFLDENGDKVRGPEEKPLENVRFRGGHGKSEATDDTGRTSLTGFSALREQTVEVRAASLKNPFWLPVHEGYRFVPRAGSAVEVPVPVTETGAIDGTVSIADNDEPIPGVPLRLVNTDGETVAETRSSFGGFFAFDQVRYGDYTLHLGDTRVWSLEDALDLSITRDEPVASMLTVPIRPIK